MTEIRVFTVRRALLLPLGLLLAVQSALLLVSLFQSQERKASFLIAVVVVVLVALLIHNLTRRVELDEAGITVRRVGRKKRLLFADLTEIEAACLRKRLFVSLWVGDSFILVTNAYANFAVLSQTLLQRVPGALVTDELRNLVENPPRHNGNILMCWLAVIFSALILYRHVLAG